MKTKNQQGFNSLLIVVVVVVVLAIVGVYVLTQRGTTSTSLFPQLQQGTGQGGGFGKIIQSDSDLTAAGTDLDTTDISSVDTQLSQLDADATSF